jgi:hypothetical protein
MWFRIHRFYVGLPPAVQLLVVFIINGVFWFFAWKFYSWYFNEPQRSLWFQIKFAAWMSLVITLPLNWNKFTSLFRKPPQNGK